MNQLQNFADDRLVIGCIYCGGANGTREHVPSKVFLDMPYPENLSVIGACLKCNNGFSKDEEYVACLVEAVVAGTADPDAIRRPGIAKVLQRSPAMRRRIEATKRSDATGTYFQPETDRVNRVLVKLAAGHAAYDLAQECRPKPASVWWQPIQLLSQNKREEFEAPEVTTLFGEIGSRSMQRLRVAEIKLVSGSGDEICQQIFLNDWVDVQSGRYRYLVSHDHTTISVRIVIGGYLAGEVTWEA